jgi:hypothetical protein
LEGEKSQHFEDLQHPEDEERDGLQNISFFTFQPLDLAGSTRELYYTFVVLHKGLFLEWSIRRLFKLYNMMDIPVLLYGSECWTLTKE